MKNLFIFSVFALLLTLGCARTSSSIQQTTTPTPPAVIEKPKTYTSGNPIFKASGNEPFWSLEIDENHSLMLKSIDDHQFEIHTPITEIKRVNDANALNLSAESADKKLTIMLMENGCQDNMSGKKSSHALQVLIKDATTGKTILYKGCGEYLDDYLVNNSWELESINGKKITSSSTDKTPTLNINLFEKKLNGCSGCNTFFGAVKMSKGKLLFGDIRLTQKACKDNTIETAIVNLFNDKAQKHTITEDGKLLIKDSERTFIFKVAK